MVKLMAQYIDKSALVAEIERRINGLKDCHADTIEGYAGEISGLERLLSFINTLEVKEVDLENLFQALPEKIADEKSHQVYELSIYHYDGQCVVDYVGEIDHDSLYTFSGNTLYEAIEKAMTYVKK